MPALFRLLASVPLATMTLAATLLAAAPARASVIYTYAGVPYTSAGAGGAVTPADPYTTDDRVTGVIELAAPLGANLPLQTITPLSFSFSDGVNTITDSAATLAWFQVATDGLGGIVDWLVTIEAFAPVLGGGSHRGIALTRVGGGAGGASVFDAQCGTASTPFGCTYAGDGAYYQSAQGNGTGVWQLQDAAVPEPTSLVLLGTAVAAVAARRRVR